MIGNGTSVLLGGGVKVMTTSGRGFTPEEVAERALDKIIAVGSNSHPAVRAQAEAFKKDIKKVLVTYMASHVANIEPPSCRAEKNPKRVELCYRLFE